MRKVKSQVNLENKDFNLNLENIPHDDFNDEFLGQYSEFSPSWRKGCVKMKDFKDSHAHEI